MIEEDMVESINKDKKVQMSKLLERGDRKLDDKIIKNNRKRVRRFSFCGIG